MGRVKKFIDDNGRWPSKHAKKKGHEERRLGQWVVRQGHEKAHLETVFSRKISAAGGVCLVGLGSA